ncbi:MAG: hypothetical protein U0M13_14185, partial [Desulfovibrio fairfieldensis]|nr:hypothetical protein [Desulfovibrio fairfieldensis]
RVTDALCPPPRFPRNFFAERVPWPKAALDMPTSGPLNPSKAWLRAATPGSAAYIRLAFALWYLPLDEGGALLSLAARTGREVLAADFKPPERNLELPACLLARALLGFWPDLWPSRRGGAAFASFLKQGGLEGCVQRAGLRVSERRPLLGGAAVLLRLTG